MALKLSDIASNMVASAGYGGLAAGLLVDSAGIPIPSEVMLPVSGHLVATGRFSWTAVLIVATLAQTAGALLSYWLAAGEGIHLVHRYGRYVGFSNHELARTHRWFESYGVWLTFFGRCIPGIRTYVGYPAGLARMDLPRFVVATVAGSALWSALLIWLGFRFYGDIASIEAVFSRFDLGIIALLAAAALWYVIRQYRKKNAQPKDRNSR